MFVQEYLKGKGDIIVSRSLSKAAFLVYLVHFGIKNIDGSISHSVQEWEFRKKSHFFDIVDVSGC